MSLIESDCVHNTSEISFIVFTNSLDEVKCLVLSVKFKDIDWRVDATTREEVCVSKCLNRGDPIVSLVSMIKLHFRSFEYRLLLPISPEINDRVFRTCQEESTINCCQTFSIILWVLIQELRV